MKEMMKKILAITLSFMVASMSLPYSAFADYVVNDNGEIIVPSKVDVQFYDVTNIETMAEGEQWTNLNLDEQDKLPGWNFERTSTLGNDNWLFGDDKKAFLNETTGQPTDKNAQRITGKFSLSSNSYFQLLSDDGVELYIKEIGASQFVKPYDNSGWYVSANNEVVTNNIEAGEYEFILDYFNWGGDGKLIFNISDDENTWTSVDSNMFYLTRTIPSINPELLPEEVKVGEKIKLSSENVPARWTKSFKWYKEIGDVVEELFVTNDEYTPSDSDLGSKIFVESLLSYNGEEVPESKEISNKVPVIVEVPELDVTFKLETYRIDNEKQNIVKTMTLTSDSDITVNAGDRLSVEHTSIADAKWTIDYQWYEKIYDLDNDEWVENLLGIDGQSELLPQIKGGMVSVQANIKYNGVTMKTESSPFVKINNLYITADDAHEFYINESLQVGADNSWVTVDAYYLPGNEYKTTPNFAIKAWDKDDGTATISGFRFEYYGVDGNLMSGANWYEFHAENDINNGQLGLSVTPPNYKNTIPWFKDDYKASWDKASVVEQQVDGWSKTNAEFTSSSKWIWSPVYKKDQTGVEGDAITRFTSPVYFRNTLSVDNPPKVSADDIDVMQHSQVELSDYVIYSDDIDSDLLVNYEVLSGDFNLSGNELNTNQFGTGRIRVTVTDSNNQIASSEFDVKISKFSSDVVQTGVLSAGKANVQTSLDEVNRLVLLAQMQSAYNIDVTANLRNDILKTNLTTVRNGNYTIFNDKFKTFVELATGDVTPEEVGYLALESGILRNVEGHIIGEADTVVVDYHDDLIVEGGSYDKKEDKEVRDSDPEWKDVALTAAIENPVVFAQIASYTGSNKTHTRISEVSDDGFKIFLEEWKADRGTNHHNHELVSYLAIKPGKHEVYVLVNGEKVKRTIIVYEQNGFGNKSVDNDIVSFDKSMYPSFDDDYVETKFIENPIVFSQVQKYGEGKQVWVRQQNVTYNSVELFAQHDDIEKSEQIGIMVIGDEAEYNAPNVVISGKKRFNTENHTAKIDATDEDSDVVAVFYSLDGVNYTKVSDTTATVPFSGSLNTPIVKVYAKAIDTYGNESDVVTKDFVYDNEAPDIIFAPENIMFNGNLNGTIGSNADDVDVIQYKVDDGTWKDYDDGFSITTDLDVKTDFVVYARISDTAGNVSEASKVYTHDPTIPNVNFGDQETEFKDKVEVIIESATNDTIYYSIVNEDDTSLPNADSPKYDAENITPIYSTKVVKAVAINSAGNVSSVIEKTFRYVPEVKVTAGVGSTDVVDTITLRYGHNVSSTEGTKQLGFLTNPLPNEHNGLSGASFEWKVKSGEQYVSLTNNTVTYKNVKQDAEGYITLMMTYPDGSTNKETSVDVKVIVDFVPTPDIDDGDDNGGSSNSNSGSSGSQGSTSSSSVPTIKVSLDTDYVELEYGASAAPEMTTYDFEEKVKGTDNKNVKWSISSNDYLRIDQNGVVSFKNEPPAGLEDFSATVTVTTVDGNKKATARVFLVEQTPLGAIEFYEPYIFGYPDQSFRPGNSVTRAEVATMFAKILKLNIDYPGSQQFSDVSSDQWYYNYVQAIARTGLFVGTPDGKFNPNAPITRAEMSAVFAKFWQYQDITVNSSSAGIKDVNGHWANEYINMMYNAGIVSGFEDGTFRPNDATLREQVVGMINTLIARPEYVAPVTKFTDITNKHWAYGNIEAASQNFIFQSTIPVQE